MVVAGASRHAKEVVEILYTQNELSELYFFDDITKNSQDLFYNKYPIIKNVSDLPALFKIDDRFILGLGGTLVRAKVARKLQKAGGRLVSIVADTARMGHFNTHLGIGLNVMEFASITNSVLIGEGCLVNAYVSVHHDVVVGQYCELAPRVTLLGGVQVGEFTAIGSGAIVLPDVKIGSNVIIGAGAVVTQNVPDNSMVVGIPGKVIKELPPIVF